MDDLSITTQSPTPGNPWFTIWLKPRGTIRWIVEMDPKHQVILLAVLGGIVQYLNGASARSIGDKWPLVNILILSLIFGSVRGFVGLYLGGFLFHWFGRKVFGGQATMVETRAAIAWSQVPIIWAAILWIPLLLLIREEMFTSVTPNIDNNLFLSLMLLASGVLDIIIGMWAFIIMLKCLGEVHRFSAWRALGTVLLPLLFVSVIVMAVLLFVGPLLY